ncbi:MAG: hypothetical protein L0Z53_00280 [Acidobacteriales bacterium]|nr:hypothetical protein [Terriglobales bacterium]
MRNDIFLLCATVQEAEAAHCLVHGAVKMKCHYCQERVLVTLGSQKVVAETGARPICNACHLKHHPIDEFTYVMTREQSKELARFHAENN